MVTKKYIHETAWLEKIRDLEREVQRCLPTLPGGKKPTETTEEYAGRCLLRLNEALEALAIARELKEKTP